MDIVCYMNCWRNVWNKCGLINTPLVDVVEMRCVFEPLLSWVFTVFVVE